MNATSDKYIAPRKVVLLKGDSSGQELPKSLSEHSDVHSWVLLGEPGAGKTEAFKDEANTSGGIYIRIAEFVDTDLSEEWKGKTLFLDGLDEVRASGHATSVLQKIANQLKRLGKPRFRIACRAADWNAVDKLDLEQVSLGEQILVLKLLELDEDDVAEILKRNFSKIDGVDFLEKAKRQGIFELMKNPQTLALFTDAFVGGRFPDSRRDTFEVACEKQLQEENDRHRVSNKNNVFSAERLMDTAGHIFALVLLSDSLGITSRNGSLNKKFLQIDKIEDVDQGYIAKIKDSRLFMIDSNECWAPSHRTIAEFLAARWLAKQLDDSKLSKRRLFNLMLGGDGGVISSLRGLYAWLVVLSNSVRDELIAKDPLGVMFYADPKVLSVNAKIQLLDALKAQANKNPNFYWCLQDYSPMGGLAAPELIGHFSEVLQVKDYRTEHQVLMRCVLDALQYGVPLKRLIDDVYSVIADVSHPSWIRTSALSVWLALLDDKKKAMTLLDEIIANQFKDDNDELAGVLLLNLYPSILKPKELVQYFHQPKRDDIGGIYVMFWCYDLVRIAPAEHVSLLLDAFTEVNDLRNSHHGYYRMSSMVDSILEHGITLHGELVSAERLFSWLGIGEDEYGNVYHENKTWEFLYKWFFTRPVIYQQILGVVFDQAERADKPEDAYYRLSQRLSGITASSDIAMWYFQRLGKCHHEGLMRIYLQLCVRILCNHQKKSELTLEHLENWASGDAFKDGLLRPLLTSPISDWQINQARSNLERQASLLSEKQARTRMIMPHLHSLSSAQAHSWLLGQLAHLWMDVSYAVPGSTVEQRFNNYSENGIEVLAAAKIGFYQCVERTDLPTVEKIITAYANGKEFPIGYPYLIGMELRFAEGETELSMLSEYACELAVAFFLVEFRKVDNSWFLFLVKNKPSLVAKIHLQYIRTLLKAKQAHIKLVYEITDNTKYSELASLVVIEVLKSFPLRAKNDQLRMLRRFMRWAYENKAEHFSQVAKAKMVVVNSMAESQKVYWMFCAYLFDDFFSENDLWRFIGSSQSKLMHLTSLLEETVFYKSVSASFLSKLIAKVVPRSAIERSYDGYVSFAEELGDKVRVWIAQLASNVADQATDELKSLIENPELQKAHALLKTNLYEHEVKKREARFRFPDFHQVQGVLACKQPANIADLHALVLDVLDDIAKKLRTSHANLYKMFWKDTSDSSSINQKIENDCRDALLGLLQEKLLQLGIDDVPEAQYFNHKRTDIRLAYGANMALPIEVKRDSHDELWTACETQLIGKYAIDPKAQGYGIYLVLWFGSGNVSTKNMTDGGRRPQSAHELEQRLMAQLDERFRPTIAIKVLDVSLPRWL